SGGENVINFAHEYIQYVVFDGLIIDATNTFNAVSITNGAHHIRLRTGKPKNAKGGNGMDSGGPGIRRGVISQFNNLKVHDHGWGPSDHNFSISDPEFLIEGCDIYNSSGYGIYISEGHTDNGIIRNNRIHDNQKAVGGEAGVTLNYGTNILFYNNLVYKQARGVEVLYGGANNVQIYNNTFVTTSAAAIHINTGITNTQVKNNIIDGNGRQIIDNGTGTSFAANLCGASGTGCTLTGNPIFVNATENDFYLQETSPAINAGMALDAVPTDVSGTLRPQEDRYDIGAYEYQRSAFPAPKSLRVLSLQ